MRWMCGASAALCASFVFNVLSGLLMGSIRTICSARRARFSVQYLQDTAVSHLIVQFGFRYALVAGQPPFASLSRSDTERLIKGNDFKIPAQLSIAVTRLIKRLLSPDSAPRPTMAAVLEDDFFVYGSYNQSFCLRNICEQFASKLRYLLAGNCPQSIYQRFPKYTRQRVKSDTCYGMPHSAYL